MTLFTNKNRKNDLFEWKNLKGFWSTAVMNHPKDEESFLRQHFVRSRWVWCNKTKNHWVVTYSMNYFKCLQKGKSFLFFSHCLKFFVLWSRHKGRCKTNERWWDILTTISFQSKSWRELNVYAHLLPLLLTYAAYRKPKLVKEVNKDDSADHEMKI